MRLVDCLAMFTPTRCTDSGSIGIAWFTRVSTSTAAMSRSWPTSKVTVIVLTPALVEVDDRYSMPSTPLICCSSGSVTTCATVAASAPL